MSLAKDSDDQAKWETEYASARQALASSQTQIASLGGIPPLRQAHASAKISTPSPYSTKKTAESPLEIKTPSQEQTTANNQTSASEGAPGSGGSSADTSEQLVREAGLLNSWATKKVLPKYPQIAKQNGATGLVRVHVLVDEAGKVIAVSRSEGPMLLRSAAEDAARQWAFQVVSIDGRPSRMSGFIDFNFTL